MKGANYDARRESWNHVFRPQDSGGSFCHGGMSSDSVNQGRFDSDKYKASLWYVPPSNARLIKRIQNGTVTLARLTNRLTVPFNSGPNRAI